MVEEFLEICLVHGKGANKVISIGYRKPATLKLSPAPAFVTTQYVWMTSDRGLLHAPEVLLLVFFGLHLPGRFPLTLYLAHLVESPSSICNDQLYMGPLQTVILSPHLSSADFL